MATITSLGTGSGIDLEGLVNKLISATGTPVSERLDFKEAHTQAKLSAFGALKSALSEFNDKIAGLASSSDFQARSATTSNKDIFTVSASNTASTGSFNVNVTSLSAAHTLATPANDVNFTFSSPNDVVGTGSLTFKFGTTTFVDSPYSYAFSQNADKSTQTITIDSSNNTLEGIKNKINSLNMGVTASIIKDGEEYRLAFVSTDTGINNSLQITVDDTGDAIDTDLSGLSRLAFNGEGGDNTHLQQTAVAADATLTINGITVSSASNSITDVVDGVTIDLVGSGSGTLTINQDKSAASKTADTFVSSYNELVDLFNVLSSYDADNEIAGTLLGDSTLRTVSNRIRSVMQSPIDGLSGAYNSLAAIGITTDDTGKLVKDTTKFQNVLDNSFDSVAQMFSANGVLSDALVGFDSSTEDTKVGSYAINITQLALQTKFVGGTAAAGAPNSINITTGSTDVFSLKVDGVQSGNLTLSPGTNLSGTDLAKEIQSLINGDNSLADNNVSVSVAFNATSNKFEITSNRYGSASKIENLSGNAISNLGLNTQDVGDSITGVDVAGSIGSNSAAGSGQFLTGAGNAKGLKIEITGGATGARGTVVFSRGYADQLNIMLAGYLDSDSIFDARTTGLNNDLDSIKDDREALSRRLLVQETRLRSQFTALDSLISQLNSTSGFLQQQLSNINAIATNNLNK